MSRDGFASLSASLLIRRMPMREQADAPRVVELAPVMQLAPEARQYTPPPVSPSISADREGRIDTPHADSVIYSGPERRQREISPLVERRRSVPPRIKISVRLEQHRYVRLRMAAEDLGRTHQDLMTKAIDHYLDMLRIPRIAGQRRDLDRS